MCLVVGQIVFLAEIREPQAVVVGNVVLSLAAGEGQCKRVDDRYGKRAAELIAAMAVEKRLVEAGVVNDERAARQYFQQPREHETFVLACTHVRIR